LRSLIHNSSDVVSVLSADGTVRYTSPSSEKVLGYRPEERLGRRALDDVHPQDAGRVVRALAEIVVQGGTSRPVEYRYRHKDGSWRHLETVGTNLLDDPAVEGIVVNTRDVTGRKEAEGRLRKAEERYRALVEHVPVVTYTLDPNDRWIAVYVSPQIEALTGYSPQEYEADPKLWLGGLHPEDRESVLAWARTVWDEGTDRLAPIEYRQRARDGRIVWVRDQLSVVRDEGGRPLFLQGVLEDITERKEAERRLKESEERHRREARELALLHSIRTALSRELDAGAVCRATVEAVAGAYGYAQVSAYLLEGGAQDGELVLQHQVGYETEIERLPVTEGVMGRSARTGRPVLIKDVREEPWFIGAIEGVVSEVCVPLTAGGETLGTLNVESAAGTELTEDDLRLVGAVGEYAGMAVARARLHERLREAEERYRTMVESIPAVVYIDRADEVSSAVYMSPQAEAMLGYTLEEWLDDPELWVKTLHPDDKGWVLAEAAHARETGGPFKAEYRLIGRDGRTVWVRDEAVLRTGGDGPPCWQGVLLDVTARKEAEEKLRGSEERFRSVVQNSSEIVKIVDVDGTLRYASPAFERVFGYGPEEAPGMNVLDHVHPEDLPRVLEATEKTLKEPGVGRNVAEYRFRHKDGSWRHIEAVGTYLLDEPSIRGVVVNARDVTRRKKAEAALKESERHFRTVVESLTEGLLMTDLDDVVFGTNSRIAEITGYAREELLGRRAYELLLPPEHWDEVRRRLEERGRGLSEHYEVRMRRKDGSPFWGEVKATPYRNAAGEVVGTVGAISDVTNRREAAEALVRSEARFRQLFEQSVDILVVHDGEGRILDCNPQACRSLGYDRDEMLALNIKDLDANLLSREERRDQEKDGGTLWQRALAGDPEVLSRVVRTRIRRKDGSTFPAEVRVGRVDFGVTGERAILASTRDVTERRLLEEKLEHLALHDPLTGLPNRRLFDDRLRQALARTHRTGGQVAVLFLDLDGFKKINDSLGHEAGDRVLVTVAERLRYCLRPEDTAARLGGDEFVVLLEGASRGEGLRVAERIQHSLRVPFSVGDHEALLTASVGVAAGPPPDTPERLVREADRAMYREKTRGAGTPPEGPADR